MLTNEEWMWFYPSKNIVLKLKDGKRCNNGRKTGIKEHVSDISKNRLQRVDKSDMIKLYRI